MLIERIDTSFRETMNHLRDENSLNVDALNYVIEFSDKFFSIDANYLYNNNDLFRTGYDNYQINNPFIKAANDILNAEDPLDVAHIEIPQHRYSGELHAIRAHRIALDIINEYMAGGAFFTVTFKAMIQRMKQYLYEISDSCLQRIIYLELIEYCAEKLKEYGVASRGWKFLAVEWKENATRLFPESEIEEEYLDYNVYLRDPKYLKRMM